MTREEYINALLGMLHLLKNIIEREHNTRLQNYYNLREALGSFIPSESLDGKRDSMRDISQIYLEQIEWNCSRQDWTRMAELCQEWTVTITVVAEED